MVDFPAPKKNRVVGQYFRNSRNIFRANKNGKILTRWTYDRKVQGMFG
eukprot:CAMPEP_0185252666 /NCGR_PEP_ID=MMETSP1359-20130426/1685_1 /TAXON_ID=552665 /ORGANISM="Bigelowiella longifila, Strain CCMP242" /LENGTH=47 /DNA_ID= /DNA_START= /DNA_END= /DNA_ORIENTATION=